MSVFSTSLIVDADSHGVRIDSFLARHFRNYTTWRLQRIVSAGGAAVAGRRIPVRHRVRQGETVSVRLLEPPDKLIEPENIPLAILFEDPWLLVISKPAGLIAHQVSRHQSGTLTNAVQHHLDRQTPRPGLLRPGIVHRIDRMTSGLIVITKDHASHRRLSISFQRGEVAKQYLAIVCGRVRARGGVMELPIGQARGSVLMSAGPDARNPRPARTRYRVLRRVGDRTLVRVIPETGRNHQIRVHLAAIGHPLVGDAVYGDGPASRPGRHTDSRHALHASELGFVHPILQRRIVFGDPLPTDLSRLIR